jgi:hypothetical protein
MKRSLRGVVLMLAIGVGRSVAQTVTTGEPSEEAAIRQVMADLATAWNKGEGLVDAPEGALRRRL